MQAISASRVYSPGMAQTTDTKRGQRLRAYRETAGLSQSELADHLGVHRSNIGFWENSGLAPRSDLLVPMAKVLGVEVSDLLGQTARPKRNAAPAGRIRMIFDAVSRLPRRQQQKIAEVVEALLDKHSGKAA